MPIKSPLASLVETIREVVLAARRYEATLSKNEAATRVVLIDPVLRALGWDLANTFMVEVERKFGDTRVDYALADGNRDVCVIVEAKQLGRPLADHDVIVQILTYAFQHAVQDVFVTDGLTWHHFADFRPGNITPIRTITLEDEPTVEAAAYLVQRLDAARFWPEERDIDTVAQQVEQLESTVTSLQAELAQLTQAGLASGGSRGDESQTLDGITTAPETPEDLITLEQATDLTGRRPRLFRLPTGRVLPVRSWKNVLVEACKAAMADNPSIAVPLPDAVGRKVTLLDKSPPPKGLSHVSVTYRGEMVYIYTNYDANRCVVNAVYILDLLPKEKKILDPAVAFA